MDPKWIPNGPAESPGVPTVSLQSYTSWGSRQVSCQGALFLGKL